MIPLIWTKKKGTYLDQERKGLKKLRFCVEDGKVQKLLKARDQLWNDGNQIFWLTMSDDSTDALGSTDLILFVLKGWVLKIREFFEKRKKRKSCSYFGEEEEPVRPELRRRASSRSRWEIRHRFWSILEEHWGPECRCNRRNILERRFLYPGEDEKCWDEMIEMTIIEWNGMKIEITKRWQIPSNISKLCEESWAEKERAPFYG